MTRTTLRGGVGTVARSGLARRRVQTAVLAVTTLVSTTASVLGVGLLLASHAPFDRAFAAQRGAHLRVDFDAATVTKSEVAATAQVPGVTAAAGPLVIAQVHASTGTSGGNTGRGSEQPAGHDLGLLTVAGRSSPQSPVDELTLTGGRWATGPGQIVLDPEGLPINIGGEFLGLKLRAVTPDGTVTLTIVGLARSVTGTANAWATAGTVARLAGGSPDYQMLYRFAHAATSHELAAARATIAAAVPPGAVTGTGSYLATRQALTANAAAFAPFVIAFGILAMILSILVIGIVVSGSVGAARRRIGIIKSIGFTPWQVARSYLAGALVPACVSVVVGAAVAAALARPVLGEIDQAYGSASASIPLWLVVAVAGGALAAVTLASLLPALRMARRSTATLLHRGTLGPPSRPVRRAQHALGTLPLPRPVALGLAAPLRRPARSAAMAATVLTGAACLTFAVGLLSSLSAVQHSRNPLAGAAVQVGPAFHPAPGHGGIDALPPDPVMSDPAAVRRAVTAMPATRAAFGVTDTTVTVSGMVGGVDVAGLSGDSSFTHHQMVAGHWLTGARGQVVLPTRALRETGRSVGDHLTLSAAGRSITVTIVGEVFDLSHEGLRIYTHATTLKALGVTTPPQEYFVALRPGTNVTAYLDTLGRAIAPLGAEADYAGDGSSSVIVAMNAITGLLAAMLLLVAGIGVFATGMLETRERVRDLGVFKSLGMTPGQIITTTLTSAAGTGLLAGAVGVPIGIAVHHTVAPAMGATAGAVLTASQLAVYSAPVLAALLIGGLAIATLGAIGPAAWAARTPAATALRTE